MNEYLEHELNENELEEVNGGTPPFIAIGAALLLGSVFLLRGCTKKK